MKSVINFIALPSIMAIPFAAFLFSSKLSEVNLTNNGTDNSNKIVLSELVKNAENADAVDFASIDAAADSYLPTNHVYTSGEAIELKQSITKDLNNNPFSLPLHWSLMRFYATAPITVGGSSTRALEIASYIYSLNKYIGCLAYEYVYSKKEDIESAEKWYKKSLINYLPQNMTWREITSTSVAQYGVRITGNFNNWKVQNMYQDNYGSYKRKVMTPKCETCQYKILVDFQKITTPLRNDIIISNY